MKDDQMRGEVVERIVDRDSKGLKVFFLLFFMLLPVSGLLLFWFDGHAKIEKEALVFTSVNVIPAMKTWDTSALIEAGTPEVADEFRNGEFAEVIADLGNLKSYDRLDADQTRAREEQDKGVIYAEVDFSGKFEKGDARVHMVVTRQSTSTQWYLKELVMVQK